MKFNFTTAKALVGTALRNLGLTDTIGKTLAVDQKAAIQKAFGEAFTAKFESSLSAEDPESFASDLHSLMKEFFAEEADTATATLAAQLATAIAENRKKDELIAALKDEAEKGPEAEYDTIAFTPKAGVSKVMTVMRKAAHYALVYGALSTGGMVSADAATIDVDQLKTEFGTYLSQNGNNLQIHRQIFNDFTSAAHFRTVAAITEYRAVQAQINSVSQQFNAVWTPAGKAKFTPLTIKNFRHKINYPIVPADVLDTYMLYLYDEELSPDQMPITKYIIHQLVYPKLMDDIELRMIFKGKYVEKADPNAPSPPEDSMDGIETQLIEAKASGTSRMNFFNGVINWVTATDAEVVKFVNDFADFVDDKLKIRKIYASKFVKRRYQRAYEALYGVNNKVVGGLNKTAEVDFVEMEITALDGMSNSPIIFATTPGNMVKLRNKNTPPHVINDVQKINYEVRLFGEYWLGVGFEIAEFVFAYVPDDYLDPQQGLRPSTEFPDGTDPDAEGSAGGGI